MDIQIGGGDTATPINLTKRLNLIRGLVDLNHIRLLDCGCGAGDYARALASIGVDAFGLEYRIEKMAASPDRLHVGDLAHMPYRDCTFDMALANEVLEHVPDESEVLSEVFRILKPQGQLIVFSPNRLFPFETHGVYLKSSDRKLPPYVPGIPLIPIQLGQVWFRYWARNYWPWELKKLIANAGFEIEMTTFVWQTFENISGSQPQIVRVLSPLLRSVSSLCERTPIIRSFGASQVIIATKV